jgi:DTW domain-containing protein
MTLLTKRLSCAACLRPQRACICHCVQQVQSVVEVLILQHPAEVVHAKGTARLLHLCLPNSRIVKGEVFNESDLQALLSEGGKQSVLLYPSDCDQPLAGIALTHIRLVVLDATWQNSRRLLRLNPLLQGLPRVAFKDPEPTRYSAIRIAHAPHQLSTIEATGAMLAALDKSVDTQPLLAAFDDFIVLQQSFLPAVRKHHRLKAAWDFALSTSPTLKDVAIKAAPPA